MISFFKKKEKKPAPDYNRYEVIPIIDTGVKWYRARHYIWCPSIGVVTLAKEYYKRKADADKWIEGRRSRGERT